jgi:hypothetical protein
VREGVWRKKNFADALAAAAFCEPAARQTMIVLNLNDNVPFCPR